MKRKTYPSGIPSVLAALKTKPMTADEAREAFVADLEWETLGVRYGEKVQPATVRISPATHQE